MEANIKLQKLESLGIMVGSDPEIFVENQNGKIVSGIGLIPGDKEEPYPISNSGHCIQVDNIAWEFNIPPSKTADDFSENIQYVLSHLEEEALSHGLVLSKKSSGVIDASELEHPSALVFGCDPDYNAYTKSMNESPDTNTKLRCVGGHVHIGYSNPDVQTSLRIVKLFDLFLVLPSSLKDTDTRRREMYGKPGSFRFKQFGVECRALSNYWIHNHEDRKWIFEETVNLVLLAIEQPEIADMLINKFEKTIATIILSNDKDVIKQTIKEVKQTRVQLVEDKQV